VITGLQGTPRLCANWRSKEGDCRAKGFVGFSRLFRC
jgi:hypothetical protein